MSKGKHDASSLKLDGKSDTIERRISGLCKDCMVLQAKASFTDKTGTRIGLDKKIYVHHIIIANAGRSMSIAPLTPLQSTCSARPSGASSNSTEMNHGGMIHVKSLLKQDPPTGYGALVRSAAPSLLIAKGNEADSTVFASVNGTLKSGYWIGKDDPLLLMTEVINYQNEPQEIYFTVDMDYLSFAEGKPRDFLDVKWGMIQADCSSSGLVLREMLSTCSDTGQMLTISDPPKDRPITFESPAFRASADGYIVGACK
jgi:hypothetical protein